ncbi:ClpXP protease specificity-enhancing factor [Pantoea sp. SoEX]|uniref:ClpXP protease specificity-enhancing factor n=1 Tax=Pantoea sp. SoEX TaxID=2576763 RepID=UPI0013579CC3|nr:ClpXP protease specificity-enhancing factor [Pantoea sp. SoEX]MXP51085.1 ClpXP protease specificity-enhancing factor [Pantoea sp. SoEX]
MENIKMTNVRPYLLRAFYNWLIDNQLTPYLLVDINIAEVKVPLTYAADGQILLNIEPNAVKNLNLGNNNISFNARFSGIVHNINIPIESVLAIYASENGIGTIFESNNELISKNNLNVHNNIQMSLIDNKKNVKDKFNGNNKKHDEDITKNNRDKKHPYLRIIK